MGVYVGGIINLGFCKSCKDCFYGKFEFLRFWGRVLSWGVWFYDRKWNRKVWKRCELKKLRWK